MDCAGCERGVYRKDVKAHVNDELLGHVMTQNAQIKSLEEQLQMQLEENKRDRQDLVTQITELETKVREFTEKLDVNNRELENEIKALKLELAKVMPDGPSDQSTSKQQQQPVAHVTGTCKP